MGRRISVAFTLWALLVAGCDDGGGAKTGASAKPSAEPAPAASAETPKPTASAEGEKADDEKEEGGDDAGDAKDPTTPKGSIAAQIELLRAGDATKLAPWFTSRQRGKITKDVVEKVQGQAGMMNVDELVESVEMGEAGGKKTAKVKMKNGRTLTTLVQEGDKWLADTIWFK